MAAGYPAPREATWVAKDFRFHTGETLPEVRLHYRTIGEPSGEPVLVLHGTANTGAGLLTPAFAGALFGPGQPLDAARHFIILPDAIGVGGSSKPSDGLKANFPAYNYDDIVAGQYRLVSEGLRIRHLRLLIGNSMGGMHAWIWGVTHPRFMDALVPMASMPTAMSGRNWMLRRLIVETIRSDPGWKGGDYAGQPFSARLAGIFFSVATTGGTLAYQHLAPTRQDADKLLDERLNAPFATDANDFLYQWDSARDYDPSPHLERIEAAVLAINAADDERNPVETGAMQRAIARMKNARLILIPPSIETRGHSTTSMARFYARDLQEFLASVPRRVAEPGTAPPA